MSSYDQRARAQAIRQLNPVSKGGGGQAVELSTAGASQHSSGVEVRYKAESVDGRVIQMGDVQFLLSPVTLDGEDLAEIVPDMTLLTKADGPWLVKHVATIRPTGLSVMHKLQLRQG